MQQFVELPVSDTVQAQLAEQMARLGRPGTWWDADSRLAIASEVRAARNCRLCRRRKEALSPYSVGGTHDGCTSLPEAMVDGVHRIATDPGRLSQPWFEALKEDVSEPEYVEMVGIIAIVTVIDTFFLAVGRELPKLPDPTGGNPTRCLPAGISLSTAWVPTVDPAKATGKSAEHHRRMTEATGNVANISAALSLVPDEQTAFASLVGMFYGFHIQLAINRSQIEYLATEVSAFNDCFY